MLPSLASEQNPKLSSHSCCERSLLVSCSESKSSCETDDIDEEELKTVETICNHSVSDMHVIHHPTFKFEIGNYGKYIVDASLCGVGSHLRKLGVDTEYSKAYSDSYILYLARTQDRIIITRSTKLLQKINQQKEKIENYKKKIEILKDRELVKSLIQQRLMKPRTEEEIEEEIHELTEMIEEEKPYKYYWLTSIGKHEQLSEVVNHFKIIFIRDNLFGRCYSCNGVVVEVKKEDIEHLVYEKTYLNTEKFTQCQKCKTCFWGDAERGNAYQRKFFSNSIAFCEMYSYHPDSTNEEKDNSK
nr:unnamed protein product [Naegleria fowleri]